MKKIVIILAVLVGSMKVQETQALPIVAVPVIIQAAQVAIQVGAPVVAAYVSQLLADGVSLEEGTVKNALTTVPAALVLVATAVLTGNTVGGPIA